jgi:hypothetical protein
MPPSLAFASFADRKFRGSLRRITAEAQAMGAFSRVLTLDETGLPDDFWRIHRGYMLRNRRMFGYGIWKPQVVLMALDQMQTGDVLLYCDAGCSLNPEGATRLRDYFVLASEHTSGLLGFHGWKPEGAWTKMDLLMHLAFDSEQDIDSPQLLGGIFMIRKGPETIDLVRRWADLMLHPGLVDDSPSRLDNHPTFQSHRHDQSAFSVLAKQHGGLALPDETWWEGEWETKRDFPIHARRWKHYFDATREALLDGGNSLGIMDDVTQRMFRLPGLRDALYPSRPRKR